MKYSRPTIKGKHLSPNTEFRVGHIVSQEIRDKISASQKKRMTSEIKKRIGDAQRGKKHTEEHKRKNSESHKGSKSYLWKGGISTMNNTIRKNSNHKEFSRKILEKDKYTCFLCGQIGAKYKNRLVAHHLLLWSEYPKLRFEMYNGICLCESCHKKVHKRLRRK